MDIGPTRLLGNFVASAGTLELPPEVADKAAFCLLDAIGLAIIAHDEATFVAARGLITDLPPSHPRSARIWSDGTAVPASDATLANAIAVHAQFHDDSDNSSWSHPASFVIPAVVAAAELEDASSRELLVALAIGYGAVEWLGAKEHVARALIERGIRTSPTLGTIAAAAGAAAIFGLDDKQAANAIGMSSSITGGVLEPVGAGSDEWRLQNAHASRGGLTAAQLAKAGICGAPEGLEGNKGLMRSLAGLFEIPSEWREPPRAEAILDVCAKPWATLGDNMSVVIAAHLARPRIPDVSAIRRVEVKVWRHYAEYPGTAYAGPFETIAQGIASMRFATAAMLAYGALEFDIPLNHREDPKILSLVPLIDIVPDDDGGPYDATVTIELADGSRLDCDARDAPRTLLFHDRPTSRELIERRLSSSGRRPGSGYELADAIFDVIDNGTALSTRALLNQLQRAN